MTKIVQVKVPENVYEYWYLTQPEECKGCECSVLNWTDAGDPKWECELDECYHTSGEKTNE